MFRNVRVSSDHAIHEKWRTLSMHSAWMEEADAWDSPAVDAVCQGLARPARSVVSLRAACQSLGEQRAAACFSLDAARADIDVAARLSEVGRRYRHLMLDGMTMGWVERWMSGALGSDAPDPILGIGSLGYLTARLDEVYAEAAFVGPAVANVYGLVLLSFDPSPDSVIEASRLAQAHAALRFAFAGGESIAALDATQVVVLAGRMEPRLSDSLAVLRSELRSAHSVQHLSRPRLKFLSLPPDRRGAATLLLDLVL